MVLPQNGGRSTSQPDMDGGRSHRRDPPGLSGGDADSDGLSDRLLQLGPINPGGMTLKSNDPDAALEAIKRLYKSTVGGNFSYNSMADFNKSSNLRPLMTNLFWYGFMTLITLIGVTNTINTLDTN